MTHIISIICGVLIMAQICSAETRAANSKNWRPEFSTAGFFQEPGAGRTVENFNVGWRFHKGKAAGAERVDFNDREWPVVNTPHGLEVLPVAASGCTNYQGEAWYRKRFRPEAALAGHRIILYFEGVMGKSTFWVNGQLVKSHLGGYLPIILDVSDLVSFDRDNMIAVLTNNSDDGEYPPGKPQRQLDFSYFGGIYRDVWLVGTNRVHITDPNEVDQIAGGGVFVHFGEVSAARAEVFVDLHVANGSAAAEALTVEAVLRGLDGKEVCAAKSTVQVEANSDGKTVMSLSVDKPHLWHVDDPYLHHLSLLLRRQDGTVVDGLRLRVGIRSIEFRGKEGFFLNGKPFADKLIGGNRHQDFACIGNAMSNTMHWRDAKKLREASMRVIRCAHYPQDPSFMDACDELGLFVIITTPGWQFWNNKPSFAKLVISDIRHMVRRDRNRPSAWLWEPVPNETGASYPPEFAKAAHDTVHQEYPYPGCYTACDAHARGQEHFDVIYSHPVLFDSWDGYNRDTPENRQKLTMAYDKEKRCVYTREWGDSVDDWNAHNSPSRVAKGWGEAAQLVQAGHYARPDYVYTCWESLYRMPAQHVGGTLWHPFDHQRGYHPDPFWGGILDAYRQPKYSYYLFRSQMPVNLTIPNIESGPFVFIAHEMTPVSGADVVVFSNCDQVRLKVYGKDVGIFKTHPEGTAMPHGVVTFKDAFSFMQAKNLTRNRKEDQVRIEAEGLIDGEVVARMVRRPAGRRHKVVLTADFANAPLLADGSDMVPIVAHVVDKNNTVKRLTNETIRFTVSGAGSLVDGRRAELNPQLMEWGEAVALVRAGTKPGKIRIKAEVLVPGAHMPLSAQLEIESLAAGQPLCYLEEAAGATDDAKADTEDEDIGKLRQRLQAVQAELNDLKLREVEKQQSDFEGRKD